MWRNQWNLGVNYSFVAKVTFIDGILNIVSSANFLKTLSNEFENFITKRHDRKIMIMSFFWPKHFCNRKRLFSHKNIFH